MRILSFNSHILKTSKDIPKKHFKSQNLDANPRSEIHKSVKWTWRSPLNICSSKYWKQFFCQWKKKLKSWKQKKLSMNKKSWHFYFNIFSIFDSHNLFSRIFKIFQILWYFQNFGDFSDFQILSQICWYFQIFRFFTNIFDIFRFQIFWKIAKKSKFQDFSDFLNFQKFQIFQTKKLKIEDMCKKSRRFVCAYLEYHRTNIQEYISVQRGCIYHCWFLLKVLRNFQIFHDFGDFSWFVRIFKNLSKLRETQLMCKTDEVTRCALTQPFFFFLRGGCGGVVYA